MERWIACILRKMRRIHGWMLFEGLPFLPSRVFSSQSRRIGRGGCHAFEVLEENFPRFCFPMQWEIIHTPCGKPLPARLLPILAFKRIQKMSGGCEKLPRVPGPRSPVSGLGISP